MTESYNVSLLAAVEYLKEECYVINQAEFDSNADINRPFIEKYKIKRILVYKKRDKGI